MHGIGADNSSMTQVVSWIHEALGPDIYVKNTEIGNGYWDSFFWNMNKQCDDFCNQMRNDPNLAQGFNLIGYSQGGMITQCYIERCNNPPVYNYISWSGPHAGQFGVPEEDWAYLVEEIGGIVYEDHIQETISFAGYWRDTYQLDTYLAKSVFLADINNERDVKNSTYKERITSLNTMVLLYSTIDTTIIPKESGWFSFYADNTNHEKDVIPLQQSQWYIEDWIGLRTLDENGRLVLDAVQCKHSQYPTNTCKAIFEEYTLPYLQNYL
jgi:palmitoyl-protein thioesterase